MLQIPSPTIVICPSALQLEGLVRILGAAGFDIVATAASVAEVDVSSVPAGQAALLVLYASKDDPGVVPQIRRFKEQHPSARIALLNDYEQPNNNVIIAALRAGVDAYFQKPGHDTLVKCLELVLLGETILPSALLLSMLDYRPEARAMNDEKPAVAEAEDAYAPRLSKRQESILRCLVDGDSNKLIARKNNIAEATVKAHVKAILREIGVDNRTQAAMWAMRQGSLAVEAGTGALPCATAAVAPANQEAVATEAEPQAPLSLAPPKPSSLPARVTALPAQVAALPGRVAALPGRVAAAMKADLARRVSLGVTPAVPAAVSARAREEASMGRRLAEELDRQRLCSARTAELRELRLAREAAIRQAGLAANGAHPIAAPFPAATGTNTD